jgi:hypothetical protein
MHVPRGILKSNQDLINIQSYESGETLPKHVNFDSRVTEENCHTLESIVSLSSTQALNKDVRLQDIEKQPEHVARVLKRFLRGDWELDPSSSPDDFLVDKILLEFPVFSLNEDYMRAIANIVFMKIDCVKNILQ